MKKFVVAAAFASSILAPSTSAFAEEMKPMKDHVVSASQSAKDTQRILKLSNEGFAGMRAVSAARLTIFNGDIKLAKDMIEEALKQFRAAAADATAFVKPSGKSMVKGDSPELYVPIDASLGLAEDFTMTEKKKGLLARVNDYFKKGDHKTAVETLKLAEIDVSYTRVMLPIKKAINRLDVANGQYEDGKFYEANLTLKAIEDSAFADTIMLVDVPAASDAAMTKEEK